METKTLNERIAEMPYWYHKIELPDGTVTPGWSPLCAEKYAVPDDLTGKRILDIGSWDGYWAWEALKRGASDVIAIDDFSDTLNELKERKRWDTFDFCREEFGFNIDVTNSDGIQSFANDKGQICRRIEMSVYDISEEKLGHFDIVFFFGTFYHLKHPLLALGKISAICDELYIESAICDDFSPYHGGINGGYHNNDMVVEFYPTLEYGNNPSNWWCPTIKCLGYMVQSVGFEMVEMWRLTEKPNNESECRGFIYGNKKADTVPENVKKQAKTGKILRKKLKIAAVMSVPRLGFLDNTFCIFESVIPLKIPVFRVQGVFWGQCLERGLQTHIDNGAEILLAIDYDTVFKKSDLMELISTMEEYPDIDALVPVQVGRGGKKALCTMKTKTGQLMEEVPRELLEYDATQISTGHFGLTLIRTSALLKMPHPWFVSEPNRDGQWGDGKVDEDINFWFKFKKAGCKAYLANHIVIGHLELVTTWPDANLNPFYQVSEEYFKQGKPKNVWK